MQASLTNMPAIAAAVTPVVMISANAILIGAISSKHQAMSDRLRALAAEWREGNVTPARREAIRMQVRLFAIRIAWISRAHFLLYVATACFIAMVLAIALQIDFLSLPLLLAGVFVMLTAIVFELLELRKAHSTMEIECREVT
jgi:anti-sigma factor RsiW